MSIRESMGIISNYMTINYLNCRLKAATPLRVIRGRQLQATANFDVSPNSSNITLRYVTPNGGI